MLGGLAIPLPRFRHAHGGTLKHKCPTPNSVRLSAPSGRRLRSERNARGPGYFFFFDFFFDFFLFFVFAFFSAP